MNLSKRLLSFVFGFVVVVLLLFFNTFQIGTVLKGGVLTLGRPLFAFSALIRDYLFSKTHLSSDEVLQLIQENERLKSAAAQFEKLRADNESLRKILQFREDEKIQIVGGRIVSYGMSEGKEFLIINQGKDAHVASGDTVIDSEGLLVGTIDGVYDTSAKVSIASNPGTTFEVETIPHSTLLLAKGLGARTLSIELIPGGLAIKQGDFVSGLTVKNDRSQSFLVGQISSIRSTNSSFKEAHITLLSHPELLHDIFIVISQ